MRSRLNSQESERSNRLRRQRQLECKTVKNAKTALECGELVSCEHRIGNEKAPNQKTVKNHVGAYDIRRGYKSHTHCHTFAPQFPQPAPMVEYQRGDEHVQAAHVAPSTATATATAASALLTLANPAAGKFNCVYCARSFRRKWDCKMHVEAVHMKIKRYRCPRGSCGRMFAHRGTLTKHIRAIHDRHRPFKCDVPCCFFEFTERGNLNKHIRRAHPKEERGPIPGTPDN